MTIANPETPSPNAAAEPPKASFSANLRSQVRSRPLEAITAVATAFGILFGLLGLGFVVWQISQVRAQLDDDAYGRIEEWQRDLDTKLIEHPSYRPYFAEGKHSPEHESIPQDLQAFAEFKLDYIDYFFTELPHLERSDIEYPVWKKYFEDAFSESPILCSVLNADQNEYGYEIRYFANSLCPGVTIPSRKVTNPEFWKYFGRQ